MLKEEDGKGTVFRIAKQMVELNKDISASGCVKWVTDICNEVVRSGVVPADWRRSWMVNVYKGKGKALECSSYRGIKLLDHVLKVLERVLEARLRKTVKIDDMQFEFSLVKCTTDAIFIVRQVQEKLLGKQKELWMAFVDLEIAFDRVPREVLRWALRHAGVKEWMVNVIKSLYEGVTTAVKKNGEESESFEVKVGVHQGSVLSPLFFNTVMQAIADNFKKACHGSCFMQMTWYCWRSLGLSWRRGLQSGWQD